MRHSARVDCREIIRRLVEEFWARNYDSPAFLDQWIR